jgi:hypothetical protein
VSDAAFEAQQRRVVEAGAAAARERHEDRREPGLLDFARGLASDTKSFVARMLAPRDARLDAIETRLAELEQRPTTEYKGVWTRDRAYQRGDFATHGGSIWHSNCHGNHSTPGQSPDWTLAVKHGRDARDR